MWPQVTLSGVVLGAIRYAVQYHGSLKASSSIHQSESSGLSFSVSSDGQTLMRLYSRLQTCWCPSSAPQSGSIRLSPEDDC